MKIPGNAIKGGPRKASVQNEFAALTWEQLLSHRARNWKIDVKRFKLFDTERDRITFGPLAADWFESMMTAAFATPMPEQAEVLATLRGEYVRLLKGLQEFLEACWPREWKDPTPDVIRECHGMADAGAEEPAMITLSLIDSPQDVEETADGYKWTIPRAQAHRLLLFSATCSWLKSIAFSQAQHAFPPAFPAWNAELFEHGHRIKPVGIFQGSGDYEITTSILNPRTLAQEIERLGQDMGNPPAPAGDGRSETSF